MKELVLVIEYGEDEVLLSLAADFWRAELGGDSTGTLMLLMPEGRFEIREIET